jgi:hypothetical protein
MTSTHYHPAHLSKEQLESLLELERQLGKTVVALQPDTHVATLDDGELGRVKTMEDTLGVVLVAYDRG